MTQLRKVTQLSWRRFLMTPEGSEAMLFLRESTPAISKGSSEEIIFAAGVTQGWTDALNKLSEFIAQEPTKSENYENP